jgi:hypothetical protein
MECKTTSTVLLVVTAIKNGQHAAKATLDHPGMNPAFTIRRHILQAKEDHLQLEQMKKVHPIMCGLDLFPGEMMLPAEVPSISLRE